MWRENVNDTEAFLTCRLTPLDKVMGLLPIEIGKIIIRIAGKVVTAAMKVEVTRSVGSLRARDMIGYQRHNACYAEDF